MDLDFRSDTTLVHGGYTTRYETVRSGMRFRYGGGRVAWDSTKRWRVFRGAHMVRIDKSEAILPEDIQVHPELIKSSPAICQNCELSEPATIRRAVTVGVDGRVTWIEPPGFRDPKDDPQVAAAAEAALKEFRFRPARAKGRSVADWAEVNVIVTSSAR